MTPNESAENTIDWFMGFDPSKDTIDDLLNARKTLSVNCTKIANYIKVQEEKFKRTYQERRIAEATTKLSTDGTGVVREARSIAENKELRIKEAAAEGSAKGAKIVLDSYYKVLDSMASYINTMRQI